MKHSTRHRLPALLLCAAAALAPIHSWGEDTDIFTGAGGGSAVGPKILIVLDNTSNWARQSQQWPGGLQQGQSEAAAIQIVLNSLGPNINLGLMEFVTGGDANDDGGFVRFAVQPMTENAKWNFSTRLNTIYNFINDPSEKRNANTPYGNLMYDIWNYFNGLNSYSPDGVLASKADPGGYTTSYTKFKSPLSDANACGRNFVIFIGNPNASGPAADSDDNGTTLTNLGGSVSPQLQVPAFTTKVATTAYFDKTDWTTQCYSSPGVCNPVDNDFNKNACPPVNGQYESCSCSSASRTDLPACPVGTSIYSVTGNYVTGAKQPDVTVNLSNTGVSKCYPDQATAQAAINAGQDKGGLSDPVGETTTAAGVTTIKNYSNVKYSLSIPTVANPTGCPKNTVQPPQYPPLPTYPNPYTAYLPRTALANSCYKTNGWNPADRGSLTIHGNWSQYTGTSQWTDPATGVTWNYTYAYQLVATDATYDGGAVSGDGTVCTGGTKAVTVRQTVKYTATYSREVQQQAYNVAQTYTQVTSTYSGSSVNQTLLGDTTKCLASPADDLEFKSACPGSSYQSCTYTAVSKSLGSCTSGARYRVGGNKTETTVEPTGTFITPSTAANADEWASFMHKAKSCNRALGECQSPTNRDGQIKQSITTYTIDVFNAQQNAEASQLYMSMARAGGGKYFAARNQDQIVAALRDILAEIQSVNTTFASASLPVNATNRTQNANQVFIGMFRPDPGALPRWFGNLKQYQIGRVGGDLDLVDANKKPATNALTGFVDDCATSFWTTGSSNYWSNIVVNPDAASNCPAAIATGTVYSDLPDGPTVEKGAVAEVLRKGNNPGAVPTWSAANRNMLTGDPVAPFTLSVASAAGLPVDVAKFAMGIDVNNATGKYDPVANPYQTRPSIHGDVVHSRPLPVNYGDAGVTVFYGANDGTLRAVNAGRSNADGTPDPLAGKERWAYIAPEHYAKLKRLKDNSPSVDYKLDPAQSGLVLPKDYFFDGSIGIYQAASGGVNPPVWIYPTQRRGGRMVYAFDVSNPASNPILKWKHGCNDLGACDKPDFEQMGQTWSTPNVAFISGYSPDNKTKPVVVMGGGYDPCEDNDKKIVGECDATKGNVVYFMDASSGALITKFKTLRAVAADVNMIDLNNDGLVDYAYVADTGGNIYRVDFVASPTDPTALPCSPSCSHDRSSAGAGWFMRWVAHTKKEDGRKFLFGPALFPTGTSTYLAIVSGDREHPLSTNYPSNAAKGGPVLNRAYVYKDDLTKTDGDPVDLDNSANMITNTKEDQATCTSDNLLTKTDKKGWWLDLNQYGPGEQGVTAAVIVGGMVTFSTNRPLVSNMSCNTRLGEARGYFVNLFNASGSIGAANNASCGGSQSATFAGGGLPPSPVIGLVPIDGVPTAVLIGAVQRDGSSSSPIKPDKIVPPINQTRARTYKYIKGDN